MDLVTRQFVDTAKLAREAGFDAVELHMGHGYLLNQFISPLDNTRNDEYGGNAENRVRFPARVLAAVKEAVGSDLAVIAKINVADGPRRGADADDAVVTARALERAGADLLVLSGGRNVESTWFMFGSLVDQDEMARMLGGDPLSRLAIRLSSLASAVLSWVPQPVPRIIVAALSTLLSGFFWLNAGEAAAWGLVWLCAVSVIALLQAIERNGAERKSDPQV